MQIKCRFCGIVTGEIESLDDVLDSRCESCTVLHGAIKEMEAEYRKEPRNKSFKELLEKAKFKKKDFLK